MRTATKKETYQIVGEVEADIENGLLNMSSPLARALIGKEEGDSVEVKTQGGTRSYEILSIPLHLIRGHPGETAGEGSAKREAGLGQGPLGALNDPPSRGMEIAGVALSFVWVILIWVYVLVTPPGSDAQTLGLVMTLLMVFLPIALIWAVVITLRSIRELRAEAMRLQATVDAMRASYVQAQGQRRTEALGREEAGRDRRRRPKRLRRCWPPSPRAAMPVFRCRPPTARPQWCSPARAACGRADLGLGTRPRTSGHFRSRTSSGRCNSRKTPETWKASAALTAGAGGPASSKLIRAEQDVLTLLSQDGIYMDDLQPDMSTPNCGGAFSAENGAGPSPHWEVSATAPRWR